MQDESRLDDLIGLLYEVPTAPERWPAALESLGDALGGCAMVMSVLPSRGGSKFVTGARVDPDHIGLIEREYACPETNPLIAAMPRLPVSTPVARQAILTDREYLAGALYNEVFRPQRLAHAAAACVLRTSDCTVPLGVLRRAGSERPDRRDLDLLARLLPHLRRSVELSLRIGLLEARRSAAEETLDRMPFGIILLDADGSALLLNRAAEALVSAADGLAVSGGALRAARPRDTAALRRLVGEAIATAKGQRTSGGGTIPLPRRHPRRPLSALVMPAPWRDVLSAGIGAGRPAAVVVITDPDAAPEPPESVLKQLYGLTHAEAALALALVRGESLKEHAERTRTSAETARWHLKHIFAKTATRKQAELVRLILRAAPPGPT